MVWPGMSLQDGVIHEVNRLLAPVALGFRSAAADAKLTAGAASTQMAALTRTLRSKRIWFYSKCELIAVSGPLSQSCCLFDVLKVEVPFCNSTKEQFACFCCSICQIRTLAIEVQSQYQALHSQLLST